MLRLAVCTLESWKNNENVIIYYKILNNIFIFQRKFELNLWESSFVYHFRFKSNNFWENFKKVWISFWNISLICNFHCEIVVFSLKILKNITKSFQMFLKYLKFWSKNNFGWFQKRMKFWNKVTILGKFE